MPYALLAFLSLLWGSSFLLISVAARGFDPLSFAFVRVAIGAAALWAIAYGLERKWPRGRKLWLRLAGMAAVGQAVPFVLLGDAARRVTSGDLALMMGVAPIVAFLLSRWLGEGPPWSYASALGLTLGLIGVAVAVGGPGGGSVLGKFEAFLSACCYACGATLSRGASRAVGPSTAAAASMTLSAAALGIGWAWSGGSFAALAAIPVASLQAMAALGQAIPFVLLGDAARRTTSGDLALMMGAAPIVAFLLSRWLGEGPPWTVASALGLALGLIGVAVAVGGPGGGSVLGKFEAFLAACCYACGATLSRDASRAVGPSTAAAASMTLSSAALGLGWAWSGGSFAKLAAIPAPSLEAMAALGLANTALAYFVYFALVVRMGATFATLNNYIVPFVGLILGAVFLHEPVALSAWAGLALVIAGVGLTGRGVGVRPARVAAAPVRP